MNPSSKITPQHLERCAYVYIRQSTPHQVEANLESQDLQYHLTDRAQALGWPAERVTVIDDDLGKSAITAAGRQGFQTLVAAVGLGQVGIILVTDVSRLARNCSDWFKLLDLASLCAALISDASGIYDPRIYDDRLLLGLKGTFSEAQWYAMRTQLCAAQMNKAKRGQLNLRLPVGFIRLDDDRIGLHPDQQVQSLIHLVFSEFERLGSAHKVLRAFRDQRLRFPHRLGSSHDDAVEWKRPSMSAIFLTLKNPVYAGTYAYGRLHRTHLPGEAHKVVVHPLPQEEWPVLIPNAFPGYISWEQYQRNQQRLRLNAQGMHWQRGAPRQGLALLQGIAICARCGRRLHVHYSHASAYVCDHATQQYGDPRCQSFTLAYIDPFVAQLFLEAVQPARLQATLAALDQLEAQRQAITQQWALRLERTRYDADLARRRYERVDPDNRLVAAELERLWDEKLHQLAALQQEWALFQANRLQPLPESDRRLILRLANDLPHLWQSASPADRKRLLRGLIQDVTLDSFSQPGFTRLHVRWQTGAFTTLDVPRPRHGTPPATAIANRLRQLTQLHPDETIAEILNAEGFPTATGLPWTLDRVRAVRRKHRIPTACPYATLSSGPRGDGLTRAAEVAQRLHVNPTMIADWFRSGLLSGAQRKPRSTLWVRFDDDTFSRFNGNHPLLPDMIPLPEAPQRMGVTTDQLRDTIRSGGLLPYRIFLHNYWHWFVRPAPPAEPVPL